MGLSLQVSIDYLLSFGTAKLASCYIFIYGYFQVLLCALGLIVSESLIDIF